MAALTANRCRGAQEVHVARTTAHSRGSGWREYVTVRAGRDRVVAGKRRS